MGHSTVTGLATAPPTVTSLSVTGRPSMAWAMFSTVLTLLTTHPTSSGMPPVGTVLPVMHQTRFCSSPAG